MKSFKEVFHPFRRQLIRGIALLNVLLVTGCLSHPDFSSHFVLSKVEPLSEPGVCARIVITQRLLGGEYTFNTAETIEDEVDEKLDIENFNFYYTIYDGYQGHLRNVHVTADGSAGNIAYGKTASFDLLFDLEKNPESLVEPFFDLAIEYYVPKVDKVGEADLGFENGRRRWPEGFKARSNYKFEIPPGSDAPEGFCGWVYHYDLMSPNGEYDRAE